MVHNSTTTTQQQQQRIQQDETFKKLIFLSKEYRKMRMELERISNIAIQQHEQMKQQQFTIENMQAYILKQNSEIAQLKNQVRMEKELCEDVIRLKQQDFFPLSSLKLQHQNGGENDDGGDGEEEEDEKKDEEMKRKMNELLNVSSSSSSSSSTSSFTTTASPSSSSKAKLTKFLLVEDSDDDDNGGGNRLRHGSGGVSGGGGSDDMTDEEAEDNGDVTIWKERQSRDDDDDNVINYFCTDSESRATLHVLYWRDNLIVISWSDDMDVTFENKARAHSCLLQGRSYSGRSLFLLATRHLLSAGSYLHRLLIQMAFLFTM